MTIKPKGRSLSRSLSSHAKWMCCLEFNTILTTCGFKHLVSLWSFEKAIGWCTAQCKMLLFYVKTIVRDSCNFELAHRKKNKKEEWKKNILAIWQLSAWFGSFTIYFGTTRSSFGHENTQGPQAFQELYIDKINRHQSLHKNIFAEHISVRHWMGDLSSWYAYVCMYVRTGTNHSQECW